MAFRPSGFLSELKRRKVYRVALTYGVVGLGILGAAELILDPFGLGAARLLIVVLVLLGFPIAIVLAWAYEVRPEEPGLSGSTTGTGSEGIVAASDPEPTGLDGGKSIIVLPFDNLSPDPGDAYFSDGLTEEIITSLSHIRSLRVISRSSAMVMKGTQMDIRTIGRELSVQYVLEGSVRKAGEDLRITAQLIDAKSDTHLWAERYEGVLDDVFGMQDKVARAIVSALRLQLTVPEERRIARRPIANAQAYDCYLRALAAIWGRTDEGLGEAERNLKAGLGIIGDNALLYAGLSYVDFEYVRRWIKPEAALAEAEDYARRAMAMDPETTQAHVVLGLIQYLRGDSQGMVSHIRNAFEIDPHDAEVLRWLGWGLVFVGRTGRARPLAERIIELDPLNPLGAFLGVVHFYEGRFEEAAETLRSYESPQTLDIPWFRWWAAYFYSYAGQRDRAMEILERVEAAPSSDVYAQNSLVLRAALRGDNDGVRALLNDTFIAQEKRDPVASCFAATFFAMLGEQETALDWLENTVGRGFINYPYFSRHDPFLATLAGQERFQRLMDRVRREWEAAEAECLI